MSEHQVLQLNLIISSPDSSDEELDRMTRQLLSQLKDFDLESVSLGVGGDAPAGTKGVESVTIGTMVMALLPTMLPQVLEFLQSWTLQGTGRTMKFKGKIAGQQIDFEGSFDEMTKIIALLEKDQKKRNK